MHPAMARRDQTKLLGVSRIEARTEWIRSLNRMVVAVLMLGLGVVVVASAVPERKRLAEKEQQLRQANVREAEVRAEKEAEEVHYQALKEDPQFLETMARDRLDYCRPDERVLRIQRED